MKRTTFNYLQILILIYTIILSLSIIISIGCNNIKEEEIRSNKYIDYFSKDAGLSDSGKQKDVKTQDILINTDIQQGESNKIEDTSESNRKDCNQEFDIDELKELCLDKCYRIPGCVYDCLYHDANIQWSCSVKLGNEILENKETNNE